MRKMYGRVEWLVLALCLIAASVHAQPLTDQVREEVRAAKREALDADLRADWDALLNARERFARLPDTGDAAPVKQYYLGYVDWRLGSLVYVAVGNPAMLPLISRAVEELSKSATLQPASADTQALLASLSGISIGLDRTRAATMGPVSKAAWAAALDLGKDNPRVQLLRAMTEFFAPPEFGGDREGGVARWKRAIELFDQEAKATLDPVAPTWGRAEASAWLGGAYLTINRPGDAVMPLERAVSLRPDFWWAARAALPQAKRQP